jgi:hypothetical protein
MGRDRCVFTGAAGSLVEGIGQGTAPPVRGGSRFAEKPLQQSALARLAVGIAAVALCLAGSFVFDDAADAVLVGGLAGIGFCGFGSSKGCGAFGSFRFKAVLFVKLDLLAFGAARIAGFGNGKAFSLLGFPVRFRGPHGSTVGCKLGGLCLGSSAATLGNLVVSNIFQISIPFEDDVVQAKVRFF